MNSAALRANDLVKPAAAILLLIPFLLLVFILISIGSDDANAALASNERTDSSQS